MMTTRTNSFNGMGNFLSHVKKSCNVAPTQPNGGGTGGATIAKIIPIKETPGTFTMHGMFLRGIKRAKGSSFCFVALDVEKTKCFENYQTFLPGAVITGGDEKYIMLTHESRKLSDTEFIQGARDMGQELTEANLKNIASDVTKSSGKRKFILLEELNVPSFIKAGDFLWASTFSNIDSIREGDVITLGNCQISRSKNDASEYPRLFLNSDCHKNSGSTINNLGTYAKYLAIFGSSSWSKLPPVVDQQFLRVLQPGFGNTPECFDSRSETFMGDGQIGALVPVVPDSGPNSGSDFYNKWTAEVKAKAYGDVLANGYMQRCGKDALSQTEVKFVPVDCAEINTDTLSKLGTIAMLSSWDQQEDADGGFFVRDEGKNMDGLKRITHSRNLIMKQAQWDASKMMDGGDLPTVTYTLLDVMVYVNACKALGFKQEENVIRFLQHHQVPFNMIYGVNSEITVGIPCNLSPIDQRSEETKGGYVKGDLQSVAWDVMGYVRNKGWRISPSKLSQYIKQDAIGYWKKNVVNVNGGGNGLGGGGGGSKDNQVISQVLTPVAQFKTEGFLCINEIVQDTFFGADGLDVAFLSEYGCIDDLQIHVVFDNDETMGVDVTEWADKANKQPSDYEDMLLSLINGRLTSPYKESKEGYYKASWFFITSNAMVKKEEALKEKIGSQSSPPPVRESVLTIENVPSIKEVDDDVDVDVEVDVEAEAKVDMETEAEAEAEADTNDDASKRHDGSLKRKKHGGSSSRGKEKSKRQKK